MSPKILKSLPSGSPQRYSFMEFEGNESDCDVFEGHTMNIVDDESLVEVEPLPETHIPSVSIEALIQKAERDADGIRKLARDQASKIEREAYENGLIEGQKTGELLAQQKIEPVIKRFETSMRHLDEIKALTLQGVTLDIIDLVVHVAEKVIRSQIESHPKVLVEMVREAMKKVKEKDQMTVFLNPKDFAYIHDGGGNESLVGVGGSAKLEQDGLLSRGSIMIKTSYGDMDATIETQVNLIKKHVQDKLMDLK